MKRLLISITLVSVLLIAFAAAATPTINQTDSSLAGLTTLDSNKDGVSTQKQSSGLKRESPTTFQTSHSYPKLSEKTYLGNTKKPHVNYDSLLEVKVNGFLTRKESGLSKEAFNQADTDGDGKLSEKEYKTFVNKGKKTDVQVNSTAHQKFTELDANKDGFLNLKESGLSKESFAKADTNQDFKLTYREYDTFVNKGKKTDTQVDSTVHQKFTELDTNKNGFLNLKESQLSRESFAKADADQNFKLTEKEYQSLLNAPEKKHEYKKGVIPPLVIPSVATPKQETVTSPSRIQDAPKKIESPALPTATPVENLSPPAIKPSPNFPENGRQNSSNWLSWLLGLGLLLAAGIASFVGITKYSALRQKKTLVAETKTHEIEFLQALAEKTNAELGPGSFKNYTAGVQGKLLSDEPLISELTQTDCVYYRMQVVRRIEEMYYAKDARGEQQLNSRVREEVVVANELATSLYIQDNTGKIYVDAKNTRLETQQVLSTFEAIDSPNEVVQKGRVEIAPISLQDNQSLLGYVFEEEITPLNQEVYVLGTVTEEQGKLWIVNPGDAGQFVISFKPPEEVAQESQAFNIGCLIVAIIMAIIGLMIIL